MTSPYDQQPERAFWRPAVGQRRIEDIRDVYQPKFEVAGRRIAAAGSCFAQHIGTALRQRGLHYLDVEPPPGILPTERWSDYGYGLYSARFGNIYNTRQLLQLFDRAFGTHQAIDDAWRDPAGRWFDAFRPTIEPDGYASEEEMRVCQEAHLKAVRTLFESFDVLVFTLGLTEAWVSTADGTAYPMCPGTAAGTFDAQKYRFCNFGFRDIYADLQSLIERVRNVNRDADFLFTVSPVGLTATATDDHVLAATTYSKSVLRAVAGELRSAYDCIDYFPSFELVSSPPMRGVYFEPNARSVTKEGVAFVMSHFFPDGAAPTAERAWPEAEPEAPASITREVCDEVILDIWGRR